MGRRREHDLDEVLDHARALWTREGSAALTIRALSEASGVSNGAIYHAFGSRDGLLARTWAREARRFLAHQREAVDRTLDDGGSAVDAVVAAAAAPADYPARDDEGARLLLSVRPDDLAARDLSVEQRQELAGLRRDLDEVMADLAGALWDRRDRPARTLVRYCLVELPGALLLSPRRLDDPLARLALERAVRGILSAGPPAP